MEGVRHGVDPRLKRRIRSAIPPTLICAKIILTQRNLVPESDNLAGLPRLPRDEGGLVFAKPRSNGMDAPTLNGIDMPEWKC